MRSRISTLTQYRAGWIALAVVFLVSAETRAAERIAPGPGSFPFASKVGELEVFTFKSPDYLNGPLIIVCHGMSRNADEYRDKGQPLADRLGAIAATPFFDADRFPNEAYQQGGITKSGQPQPP